MNSNGSGVKTELGPAVAGSVATTTPKMEFCQKEELIGHHTIRIGDGDCSGAPVYCHTGSFINQVLMIAAGGLQLMVWHKRKQAVRICIAITELYFMPVGLKTLHFIISRLCRWNDSKEDVIVHEGILWFSVPGVTIQQKPKVCAGKRWERLNESIRFTSVVLLL